MLMRNNWESNLNLQIFFISRESVNSPLIIEIIRFINKFKDLENITSLVISLEYGKRIIINTEKTDFRNIKKDDFVEIVDYDPAKNTMLIIGKKEPLVETPIHWIIHNARKDINAIIQFYDQRIFEKKNKTKIITTEEEKPSGTLELSKEILKALRNSKNILIKNQSGLSIGRNLKEAEEQFLELMRNLNEN